MTLQHWAMRTEEQAPSQTSFPPSWTLSKSNPPIANAAQSPAILDAYPREWSLSTISESISDATETQDRATSQNTFRGDFPIALSNTNETALSIISSPSTFERSWTLPPSASIGQPTPPHGGYRGLVSSTWSPGMLQHDMAERKPRWHHGIKSSPHNSKCLCIVQPGAVYPVSKNLRLRCPRQFSAARVLGYSY